MALRPGLSGASRAIELGVNKAVNALQGFAQPGRQAAGLQAALSGALGSKAQAAAFANFQSSPGQQFLREQGERAVMRNAAALGGLDGGNVLKALTRFGQGLAQQDFQNQFNNLGKVAGTGLTAAQGQANVINQGGVVGADAALRTGSALSNLINQQGKGLSAIIGQSSGNLANLLTGTGTQQAQSQQQLATLLANLATQQGSTTASLPGIPGIQETRGILGSLGQAAGGAGGALQGAKMAGLLGSDRRLKENIQPVVILDGLMLYLYNYIGESGRYLGRMADEVKKLDPKAVININGYDHVTKDYHPMEFA